MLGPSVGKVGPYIHISTLIASRLMKIEFFSAINHNSSARKSMLSCAIAVWVTVALGTPLGGVIFSIETTSTVYNVGNLWKSFFACVMCKLTALMIKNEGYNIFDVENTANLMAFRAEMIIFAVLGVFCGFVGASYATFIAKINYMRKTSSNPWLNDRFRYAFLISSWVTFFSTPRIS